MNRASVIHGGEIRWIFRSIGTFIAKAIADGQILGATVSDLLLCSLRGEKAQLDDLKVVEPEVYHSLQWILSHDVTEADLSFSVSYEGAFGQMITVALGGHPESTKVTEENKESYVDLMIEWLAKERYEPSLSHLLSGFNAVVIQGSIFSSKQFSQLISNNTIYLGYYVQEILKVSQTTKYKCYSAERRR